MSVEQMAEYNVVCVTEILENIDKVIEANEFCRLKNVGFILS